MPSQHFIGKMHPKRHLKRRREESPKALPDLVPSLPTASQASCPLFTVLPAEVRNRIYALSVEPEDIISTGDSPRSLYRRNAFYYRPGYKQPKRIQTALLQRPHFSHQPSMCILSCSSGLPRISKMPSSPLEYFRKMAPTQRAQVQHQHLHFLTQQFFLEDHYWSRIWCGMEMGDGGRSLRGKCRIAQTKSDHHLPAYGLVVLGEQ